MPLDQALKFIEDEAVKSLPKGYKLDYTGESRQLRGEGSKFLPALLLALGYLGASSGGVGRGSLLEVRWMLDRAWILFSTLPYIAGGWLLRREIRRAEDPIVRRQLQWLRRAACTSPRNSSMKRNCQ